MTFDAGEGAGYTEQILDLLAEYGIKGTFGVTGQWAEQNPGLMLRIVAEGHQIINHTYDHQSYTGVSTEPGRWTRLTSARTWSAPSRSSRTSPADTSRSRSSGSPTEITTPLRSISSASWGTAIPCGGRATPGWNGYTPDEIVALCGPENEKDGGVGAIILMHVADDNDWEALEPSCSTTGMRLCVRHPGGDDPAVTDQFQLPGPGGQHPSQRSGRSAPTNPLWRRSPAGMAGRQPGTRPSARDAGRDPRPGW